MSRIHYFQRYDSKENWATNSTLLLLSRLYHFNRLKYESVINAILIDGSISVNIGVNFAQQQSGRSSVVDGVMSQSSFQILIETKLYDNFSTDQLTRHLDAFTEGYSQKVLLALSKNKVNPDTRNEIIKVLLNEKYKDIKFASTSYEEIFQIINDNLSEYDLEMREVLEDYVSLCHEHGLVNIKKHTLLAFTCNESHEDNLEYDIYYDGANRNHNQPFKYIGLYRNKTVFAIGKLRHLICCDYEDGKLVATNGSDLSVLTASEYDRIKTTIEKTDYYDLREGMRFFLVDRFYNTSYVKTSFSSIRTKKYFYLDEIEGYKESMKTSEIAELLNGKTWE